MDEMIVAYRAAVSRLQGDYYGSVPQATREQHLEAQREAFEVYARRLDDEISWAAERVSRNAGTNPRMAILAYNQLLEIHTRMWGAITLFPEEAAFVTAYERINGEMIRLGSREEAAAGFESAALAAAADVRMPPAISGSENAEGDFRRAWATSGIPYTILRIHVTSGWRDKIEYGRVTGQRRDAAIAAVDPENAERCNLYSFTIFRDLSGSVRRDSHSTTRIACENVPD